MKISIIIPVYNAEKFIHKCVDSVLSQTFTDFELLLINDGSKDKSGEICDAYAAKDSRVHVFHKKNGGVGSARNVGIRESKGEFMTFIDADDELLDTESLSLMFHPEFDMSICGYDSYDISGKKIFSSENVEGDAVLYAEDAVYVIYNSKYYIAYCYAKLYKSSIIKDYGIYFDESIYYNEDKLFVIEYLSHCTGNIYISSVPVYKYMLRESGAMNSIDKGYNAKIITAYYASLKVLGILRSRPFGWRVVNYAKKEVYTSYHKMLDRLVFYNINDDSLENDLKDNYRGSLNLFDRIGLNLFYFLKNLKDKIHR